MDTSETRVCLQEENLLDFWKTARKGRRSSENHKIPCVVPSQLRSLRLPEYKPVVMDKPWMKMVQWARTQTQTTALSLVLLPNHDLYGAGCGSKEAKLIH